MASSAGLGLPAGHRGVSLPVRATERAKSQRRPVPGNSPDDRKDYPDFESSQESLRRCLPAHPATQTVCSAAVRTTGRAEGPQPLRFSGMTESIGPMWSENQNHLNLGARCRLPLIGPRAPVQGRDGRSAPCSSSAMSSGRLFLDRVARQHCPSLLHRHPQNNTHPSEGRAKDDISTLPGGRHFYFALTLEDIPLTSLVRERTLFWGFDEGSKVPLSSGAFLL